MTATRSLWPRKVSARYAWRSVVFVYGKSFSMSTSPKRTVPLTGPMLSSPILAKWKSSYSRRSEEHRRSENTGSASNCSQLRVRQGLGGSL